MMLVLQATIAAFAAAITLGGTIIDAQEEISVGTFRTRQHLIAGEIVLLSTRVFEVRNFVYDGQGPAVFFWATKDAVPNASGYTLADAGPDGSCGTKSLGRANGDVVHRVEFPDGMSIKDFLGGSISAWCEAFDANFGEVVIPKTLDLEGLVETDVTTLQCFAPSSEEGSDPPATTEATVPEIARTPPDYNCEPLSDKFQVRWAVKGDSLSVELVGLVDDDAYLGFGPSGSDEGTLMEGSDVVIADGFNGQYRAVDYYMSARAQCSNGVGVCPDEEEGGFQNDVTDVSGERDDEFEISVFRYTRPLSAGDAGAEVGGWSVDRDISVTPGDETYISWAIGPVSPDTGFPNFHAIDYPRGGKDFVLEFGRDIVDNCEPLVTTTGEEDAGKQEDQSDVEPFDIPTLRDVTEFTARIGPSAGERGYVGITGQVSWGIAWYINDYLVPVIEMKRGTTYTFRINGGDDPSSPSEYHPFYLTTSKVGGYDQISPEERLKETVIAGVDITEQDGDAVTGFTATEVAPICLYKVTDETTEESLTGDTYENFFSTLDTSCADDASITDNAAVLEFTPTEETPDIIYYQCVTHRNLGWEIRIVDDDDVVADAREVGASTDSSSADALPEASWPSTGPWSLLFAVLATFMVQW